MCRLFFISCFLSCSVFAQDSLVLISGDTVACTIVHFDENKFSYIIDKGSAQSSIPSSEVKAFYKNNVWSPVLNQKDLAQYQRAPDFKLASKYLNNAGAGLGLAGVGFLLGGGTLIVSSALAQSGNLTSPIPFYFGYGLLVVGGIGTIGASISLVKASKGLPRVKLTAAGVPLN